MPSFDSPLSVFSFVLLLGLALLGLLYNLTFYLSFKKITHQKRNPFTEKPFVSIIVCAKNAGRLLPYTVKSILAQNYQDYELIVVNDFSTDDSFESLAHIKDPKLKIIQAKEDKSGKKMALTSGILAAKGPLLLMTDADCLPASTLWIESMVASMMEDDSHEIVIGYGPMKIASNWVNRFSRYETALTAMQYMSYAIMGKPYMGVGRNLMYKKSLWLATNGFESHKNIISGDDDLFVSQAATSINTKINLDPSSFVFSESKSTWKAFLRQKTRHISTSFYYTVFHKVSLALFSSIHILFWFLGLLFVLLGLISLLHFLIIILIKWSLQILLSRSLFTSLYIRDLLNFIPVLDIMLAFYYLTVVVLSGFRKNGW